MPWNWNATLIFYTYSWIHNSIAIKVYKDFPLLYKKIPTGWHWLVYLSSFTYVNLYLNMSCSDEFCSSEIFRGVYRPLWPPSPMSIRQTMVGQSNKFCRFILLTWFHAEPLMNLHSAVEMVILRRVNFVADILYLCAPHYG